MNVRGKKTANERASRLIRLSPAHSDDQCLFEGTKTGDECLTTMQSTRNYITLSPVDYYFKLLSGGGWSFITTVVVIPPPPEECKNWTEPDTPRVKRAEFVKAL